MRLNLTLLIAVIIGLALGGGSAWYSLKSQYGIGGIRVGAWTAWPFSGGTEADPYTIAKVTREGTIPLGATEGLAFEAANDTTGDALTFDCNYILSGLTPPARLWTLTAYRPDGSQAQAAQGGTAALHSGNIIRFADGSFRISISNYPVSGNWLGVTGSGGFYLVLRVYDTPATTTTGLVSRRMPSIIKGECS